MSGTLYTIGYQGRSPEELHERLPDGAAILDIRLKPWSRDPRWQRARLAARLIELGRLYLHVGGLGNLAYKTGGIEIADIKQVGTVLGLLHRPRDVALLCVCADWRECHRLTVADLILERDPSIPVIHVERDGADPPLDNHPRYRV